MRIIAVTQARVGSTRLPGKVLKEINGVALLQMHLERVGRSNKIDKLIVATTTKNEDDSVVELSQALGIEVYRGSTDDVLDRYYQAVKNEQPGYVVRITSDCPLIDATIVDEVIEACVQGQYDYCSNCLSPTFPDGMDVEVMKFSALEKAWNEARLTSEREHVTSYIWKNSTFFSNETFTSYNITCSGDFSKYRLTIDEQSDYDLLSNVVTALGYEKSWKEYVCYLQKHPELLNINAGLRRNEGLNKSMAEDRISLRHITDFAKSDEYRKSIHNLIPGGAHTYSKGDDQFPERAPAAISHGKGAYVWDVDGNKFLDCSMGLTSVSLGHAYEVVTSRVTEEIQKGVNFQRPSYIERQAAEAFLELVPQHDMIKFAKSGSIVTTAAVKLARAFTGRKLVAFPHDHPFYSYDDWFIGKTACSLGVPDEIASLSVTYKADDLQSLAELFEKYPGQIACVISEPEKNWGIPDNYLSDAIALAHKNGSLYIADEMITGFKTAFPGSITKYNVVPDMATWGKGIANGFSFCALTGTKEVMELGGIQKGGSEKVFLISTTHGGETHAIAAALATIQEFKTKNVIEHNHSIGDYLLQICNDIIKAKGLEDFIEISPSNWMPVFVFKNEKKEVSAGLRTFAMQEMISRGVLFQGAFSPCFSHTRFDVEYFAEAFDQTMAGYIKALEGGFEKYLIGQPAKPVFRKYL